MEGKGKKYENGCIRSFAEMISRFFKIRSEQYLNTKLSNSQQMLVIFLPFETKRQHLLQCCQLDQCLFSASSVNFIGKCVKVDLRICLVVFVIVFFPGLLEIVAHYQKRHILMLDIVDLL